MDKHYTFAKPGYPNWVNMVERAAIIIADANAQGKENQISTFLVHSCSVNIKYYPRLREDAEALLKQRATEWPSDYWEALE